MRVIGSGYRHWRDHRTVWARMQRIQDYCAISRERLEVAVGDCPTGVDLYIRDWMVSAPVIPRIFYAKWGQFGNRAGPLRNEEMIDTMLAEGPVDMLLAFMHPKAVGTPGCARYARSRGIYVEEIWEGL